MKGLKEKFLKSVIHRLSGFWYPCRKIERNNKGDVVKQYNKPKRLNEFLPETNFNEIFKLYTFDKRLRFLLLDAIERIEINLKTVLAHEIGKSDELAYQKTEFINPSKVKDYYPKYQRNKKRNSWIEWSNRQQSELSRSKEDSIIWHRKTNMDIPIWVAVESWSFGTLSIYFELLKQSHQNQIANRLRVSNSSYLIRWLQSINTLRNRCAHHTRIWNQSYGNPIGVPTGESEDSLYFSQFNLTNNNRKKLFGLIVVIWYLVKNIGPNSDWIINVLDELENFPQLPICCKSAMGIPEEGLLIDKFLSE